MCAVFSPYIIIDTFVDWFGVNQNEFTRSDDINVVLAQNIKIACLPVFFDQYIDIDYMQFDLLLLSDIECNHISEITAWINRKGITNSLLAIGALGNFKETDNIIYRPWWAFNVVNTNQYRDSSATSKLYKFDILLGTKKPHRDFVMANIQQSGLIDTSMVTYRTCFNLVDIPVDKQMADHINHLLGDTLLLYPYTNIDMVDEVCDQITNSVSNLVPWKIYDKTQYSVVTETLYDECSFFFTEKTAKAIFAKRMFIIFSSQYYLSKLQELGFKTFSSIIDETYDTVNDNVERFTLAMEQMNILSELDYPTVTRQIQDIVDHNYQRLVTMETEIKLKKRTMIYNKIRSLTC